MAGNKLNSGADPELFRDLINKSNDAIFVADTETGLFIFVNDKACTSLGYERKELLKMGVMDIEASLPDNFLWHTHVKELRRKGSLMFEGVHKRKNGTTFPVEANISHVVPNRGEYLVTVVRDITERKRTEDALSEREKQLAESQRIARIGSWEHNMKTGRVFWSDELFLLCGLNPTTDPVDFKTFFEMIHPDDQPALKKARAETLKDKKPFSIDYRLIRRDGTVSIIHAQAELIADEEGDPVILSGTAQDITELKRAEEERAKLQSQLFQLQKMESVGRLAGGVAHDFNNMLSAILGYAEMALMQCKPSEKIHSYLRVIEQTGQRSAAIVRQLLAFSRNQPVAPKVLDLNETVAGMLRMLQRLIGEEIDFAWVPARDLWPIEIDPSQIDQLLANLCVNARDAISGVGKIAIMSENAVFDGTYCAGHPGFVPGEYVMLAVSDNGCGMSREIVDHLFEPFFTTKEVGKGTGLGLATVYGIVKQNKGLIDVWSEPGKGSTFRIYLPRFTGEVTRTAASVKTEIPRGLGETVLLVEDDKSILNMYKDMLESLGYRVLTSDTPGGAIRLVAEYAGKIDLLITDVIMPEMNGWDLAESLGRIIPDLKCLLSSGYMSDILAHGGKLDKGMHFLQKPFSRKDLATKVREVLEKKDI